MPLAAPDSEFSIPRCVGWLSITEGRANVFVSQALANGCQIDTIIDQVRGVEMAQVMYRTLQAEPCTIDGPPCLLPEWALNRLSIVLAVRPDKGPMGEC